MAYNFPSNPTLDQVYTYNGRSWKWNGVQWVTINIPTSTGASAFFSYSAPENPVIGSLWYDARFENLKIWGYLVGDEQARWIDVTPSN